MHSLLLVLNEKIMGGRSMKEYLLGDSRERER